MAISGFRISAPCLFLTRVRVDVGTAQVRASFGLSPFGQSFAFGEKFGRD